MKRIYLKTFFFIVITTTVFFNAKAQTYQWAKSIGGTGSEVVNDIAVDGSGNVYVIGWFNNTADFDPGPGTVTMTASGTTDVFFAKYDANGNYIWAKRINCNGGDAGESIALDAAGNVCIVGYFSGTGDFDPGPGTATLASSALSNTDVFFGKYDSNGNYIWAKRVGGSGVDLAYSIASDAIGNYYVTGSYQVTADFDPGPATVNLTAAGAIDVFFAKYDTNGNYLWAKSIGSTNNDRGYGIAVDVGGNVCLTGYFSTTVDFDPGPGTVNLTAAGANTDIFFAKYDGSGNYIWAKSIGGTGSDIPAEIVSDAGGNIYITGYFLATVDFDPGPGTSNLTSLGAEDIFFGKYDNNGNYIWAKSIGSTTYDGTAGMALDAGGNVYLTGFFYNTADFDPGAGIANLTPAGNGDIFFGKYDNSGNYLWAQKIGNTGIDEGYSIVATGGNVYICGTYSLTADFDPGPGIANLTVAGNYDGFFGKYSSCALPSTPGTISGNITLCSGSNNTYSVVNDPSVTSYSWALPGGWSGTSTTNTISTTAGATGGSITVTANNSCGTSSAQTLSVTVNSIPVASANTTQTLTCVNTTATLNGSGVSTYTWSGPGIVSGGNSATPTANMAGTYSLIGTTSGCVSNTATVSLTSDTTPPTVSVTATGSSICTGNSATLTASGASTYSWSTGSTATAIVVSPTATTNYTVTGTNSANGCTNSTNQSIGVDPLPIINVSTNSLVICGPPFQGSSTLTANGASTYTWNTTETTASIVVSPSVTTNYTVNGTDNNGCMNSTSFTQSVSACISVQEFGAESSELQVFPNPTTGLITLISPAKGTSARGADGGCVEVYNLIGEKIYKTEISKEKTELDLSNQLSGIYFIRIGTVTKKIIKE